MNNMKAIQFSPHVADDIIRAILEGRKTVTRRIVSERTLDKYYDYDEWCNAVMPHDIPCTRSYEKNFFMEKPPYRLGDILYVRETWHQTPNGQYWYKADSLCVGCTEDGICLPKGVLPHKNCKLCEYVGDYYFIKWRPSIRMPREAARLFLRVTDVRVERLQDITDAEAEREGCEGIRCNHDFAEYVGSMFAYTDCMNTGWLEPPTVEFAILWDSTIKKTADRALYGWDANPWVWVIEFERHEKTKR